eukprot:gene9957-20702_t
MEDILAFCIIIVDKQTKNDSLSVPSRILKIDSYSGESSIIYQSMVVQTYPRNISLELFMDDDNPNFTASGCRPISTCFSLGNFTLIKIDFRGGIPLQCAKSSDFLLGNLLCQLSDDWDLWNKAADEMSQYCKSVDTDLKLDDVYRAVGTPQLRLLEGSFSSGSIVVPDELLSVILLYLDAQSLYMSSCACKLFRNLTMLIVPGLTIALFPHQSISVWWIRSREALRMSGSGGGMGDLHPQWRTMSTYSGKCYVIDRISGRWGIDLSAPIPHIRGGLLCDEPGLGKTVTILAVILRSHGVHVDQTVADVNLTTANSLRRQLRSPSRAVRVETLACLRSSATLILVPDVLLEHWKEQIIVHTRKDCRGDIFVDDNKRTPLPNAETLASMSIVLVTHRSRLSREWRHGRPSTSENKSPKRFADECHYSSIKKARIGSRGHERVRSSPNTDSPSSHLSPLLSITWLRLVVDEGHSVSKGSSGNSVTAMAHLIQAERRWILTGTPLPSTEPSIILRHLFQLLRFLRFDPFEGCSGAQLWRTLVSGPVLRGEPKGFQVLIDVLKQVMVRHTKESISIPKPVWTTVPLSMSPPERDAYNAVTALARANFVITELDYDKKERGARHPDSLLNPTNRQYLQEMLLNLRIASCGGGRAIMSLPVSKSTGDSLTAATDPHPFLVNHIHNVVGRHTLSLLVHECEASETSVNRIFQFMNAVVEGVPWPCERCRDLYVVLLITPCAHLFCPNCLEETGDHCFCCDRDFDWNMLQRLQPGFEVKDYQFEHTVTVTASFQQTQPHSQAQLQPLLSSAFISQESSISSKAMFLVNKIKEFDDSSFSVAAATGQEPIDYLRHTSGRHRDYCQEGHRKDRKHTKIVIFSQFPEFLAKLRVDLSSAGVIYESFTKKTHMQALTSFRTCDNVHVLLLSRAGALGIDLSFATHLFLMDTILDKELEDQVVSRVYRMGCTQAVQVYQLVMSGTLEEHILSSRDLDWGRECAAGDRSRSSLVHRRKKNCDGSSRTSSSGHGPHTGAKNQNRSMVSEDDLVVVVESSTDDQNPVQVSTTTRHSSSKRNRRTSVSRHKGRVCDGEEKDMDSRLQYLLLRLQFVPNK